MRQEVNGGWNRQNLAHFPDKYLLTLVSGYDMIHLLIGFCEKTTHLWVNEWLKKATIFGEGNRIMEKQTEKTIENQMIQHNVTQVDGQTENDKNTPTIITEHLILRKFTEEDIEALYEILKDEEVNTFLPWYPLKSIEETKEFYEKRYAEKYRQPQGYAYAICLKGENYPIGYIKVDMEEHHDFGYGLRKEFWHKGIVTEAGKHVIEQVKKDGLPYITATHDINNPRSGKVMQRLGMKYCYSYEEQWQPKDFPVIFRMYQLNFDGNEERVYKKYWNIYENHFVEAL